MLLPFFFLVSLSFGYEYYQPPEQIHIALGQSPDQMTFTWTTFDYPINTVSTVKIGLESQPSKFNLIKNGTEYLFTDPGSEHINRTIHVVNISNLLPSTRYYYQVGDPYYGWSSVYSFKTMMNSETLTSNLPQRFVIFGDMGTTNTQACNGVTELGLNQEIDVIIHVGDMAYDMYENNGTNGDLFMNDIQAVATVVPYMVCPGNHENKYNFSEYSQRFRGQPSNTGTVWTQSGEVPNNWYYSYNVGLVHFIALSSEIYFDYPWMIKTQYNFLINDLEIANKNRTKAPWIIVYHHRLLYCSATGSECDSQTDVLRNGVNVNGTLMYGLDDVYYKYGVDFVYNGHVHNYERMYDIYKNKTTKSTMNMPATTYIANGDAGNREGHHNFNEGQPEWSAFRTTAYSFSRFDIYNETHIHLQQVVSDSELPPSEQGKVIDEVWYIQTKHGPFDERGNMNMEGNEANKAKSVTYDPYAIYGIEMKIAPSSGNERIEYISDNKDDYRGIHGVYF